MRELRLGLWSGLCGAAVSRFMRMRRGNITRANAAVTPSIKRASAKPADSRLVVVVEEAVGEAVLLLNEVLLLVVGRMKELADDAVPVLAGRTNGRGSVMRGAKNFSTDGVVF